MGLMVVVGAKRINWFLEEYAPPPLQHDLDDYTEDVKKVTNYLDEEETAGAGDADTMQEELEQAVTMGVAGSNMGSPRSSRGGYAQLGKVNSGASKMRKLSSPRGRMKMPRNPEQEERALYASQA